MTISAKAVPVEVHWYVGLVERAHLALRSTYGSFTVYRKAAWFIYGPLEGLMVYFMDCEQDSRPA